MQARPSPPRRNFGCYCDRCVSFCAVRNVTFRKSGEREMVSAARSSADAADISEGDTQTNLSHAFLTEPKHVQSVSSRDSRFAELAIFPEVEERSDKPRKWR